MRSNIPRIFPFIFIFAFIGLVPANAQRAIDFTLIDLEGKSIKLSDHFPQNIVLLNFWATWCVPCIKEMPHFQKLNDTYKTRGLKIFAISVNSPGTIAQVKTYMERYKFNFPVLLDEESHVLALYNPRVILPYTVLIDKEGNIKYIHQGYSPGDEILLEQKIVELLEPKEVREVKKFSYHLNETFLNRNFSDKDYVDRTREGRSSQIINQLDLTLTGGAYLLGMRLDSNLDFSPWKDHYSLAKRFIEVSKKNYSLRIGDFYHSAGRGLVLSVLKTFETEGLEYIIDTTIDGGKFSLRHGSFFADISGGWIDREESHLKDKILSSAVGWRFKKGASLQFHYLRSQLEPGSAFGNKNVTMESISLEVPKLSQHAKFYGEFSLIQKDKHHSSKRIHGYGVYIESSFFAGNFSVLMEFKDYKNLDFEYNRPPLLESEELEILANQFDTETTDITGISARMDYYSPELSTLFYAKFSFQLDNPENHPTYGEYKREISHFFGGAEKKFKSTGYLNILAGYRKEHDTSIIFLSTHGNTFHYQLNLSYPLTSRLSLEVDWKSKDFQGKYLDYYEKRSFISFHYSPRLIFTLFLEQTNDPEIMLLKPKKNWWAGQVELKITSANSLRIFFGSTKGAVKCSGGTCRLFPPFEGLRVEAIMRF